MSVCARKFFDCGSGLNGDVMEARERAEFFTAADVGDLFSWGRILAIDGDWLEPPSPGDDGPSESWCREFCESSGFMNLGAV